MVEDQFHMPNCCADRNVATFDRHEKLAQLENAPIG
jgi:hypothetical protein